MLIGEGDRRGNVVRSCIIVHTAVDSHGLGSKACRAEAARAGPVRGQRNRCRVRLRTRPTKISQPHDEARAVGRSRGQPGERSTCTAPPGPAGRANARVQALRRAVTWPPCSLIVTALRAKAAATVDIPRINRHWHTGRRQAVNVTLNSHGLRGQTRGAEAARAGPVRG